MRLSLLALLVPLAIGCQAPKKEVTPEQVQGLTKLDDVMAAQATYADPLMKKRDQLAFSDAEYASMIDASARLQATSMKTKEFSKGPAFDDLAARLHGQAEALGAAGQAKDSEKARAALTAMRDICRECHTKFR